MPFLSRTCRTLSFAAVSAPIAATCPYESARRALEIRSRDQNSSSNIGRTTKEYYLEKRTPYLQPWRDFVAILDAQAEALNVGARARVAVTLLRIRKERRGLVRLLFLFCRHMHRSHPYVPLLPFAATLSGSERKKEERLHLVPTSSSRQKPPGGFYQ